MTNVADLIAAGRQELGHHENPPGSNVTTYGQELNLTPAQWCMQLQSHVLRSAGYAMPREAQHPGLGWSSVGFFRNWARDKGYLVDGPEPGVFACFEWEHDAWPDHVGLVTAVYADGSFLSLEGNTSGPDGVGDEVTEKVRPRTEVQSWVKLPLDAGAEPSQPPAPAAVTPRAITPYPRLSNGVLLSQGSQHHDFVGIYQQRMIARGWNLGPSGADGVFGPITDKVTTEFQTEKHLHVDGVVGPETWTAAFELPVT